MRILLVAPRSDFPDSVPGWIRIPQMSLLILEKLSGNGHHVVTIEEDSAPLPIDEKWDLVGITVMTSTARRAYALSKMFRERGAKVILGGIHPSVLPEEASQHADAVLVGEAEPLWQGILEDAARGSLQPIYYNLKPETIQVPLVNYRQGKKSRIPTVSPIIATRGCPNGCEFCSVHRIYGHRVRKIPVGQVLEQVKRSGSDYLAFLDDNLTADREYALELFTGLRNLQVKFIAQVSIKFILDDDLFQMAVAAGLKAIFVGFETIDKKALRGLKKSVTLDACGIAIRKCRAAGVLLHGAFIFGLDEHDKTIFGQTLDFILEHKIPSVGAYMLTPYPGTRLYDRMVAEGRLLHRNWGFYDHGTPVFLPARMTLEELAEGYMKFRESLFSLRSIAHRFLAGFSVNPYVYLHWNFALRRVTFGLRDHYKNYFNWLKTSCPASPTPCQ